MKFKIDDRTEEEYIFFRFTNNKTKDGQRRIEKIFKDLLEVTGREISRDSILKFQNWYMTKYSHHETRKKYYTNTRNFLEWLYKKTGDYRFRELKELLVTPKRPSKKINSILLREDDVRNVVSAIYKLPINPHDSKMRHYYSKIKFIAFVLLASYTGQRPESTLVKLTLNDIREALERDPPMLWIPEEKDKESFPHWVPLHPVVVEWLKPVIEFYDIHPQGPSDNRLFHKYPVYKLLKKINVKAIHTGIPIRPSHFRKFFEQMCNNVLMVHPGLRDYIMAHNTGSLDVQSYDGKLPSEIYYQYMEKWGKVNLVPPEVKLEELIHNLSPTGD
ncbi:hypothetical protein [Geoglobus acetivorans]|uniref:Core-binding (CB) domain-containing protein n=1 Tax=Geoglobus acetivorans TaxID=565033 RepID=A0ABZ3H294_GEOAI|nr:hypothetical protein [Geoglobus acetivorans]